MNFLAHIYLSGDDPELMVGNFIGDFVKGNQFADFNQRVQDGITLHRSIDAYTDSHEVVRQSKERLRKKYRHYAGVIVDIYYDHFLAAEWDNYHATALEPYVDEAYQTILGFGEMLPQRVHHMLKYMIPQNWLVSYRDLDGIGQALAGLSRRTKFNSNMEHSIEDLEQYYDEFGEEFRTFFEDLRDHVKKSGL